MVGAYGAAMFVYPLVHGVNVFLDDSRCTIPEIGKLFAHPLDSGSSCWKSAATTRKTVMKLTLRCIGESPGIHNFRNIQK
ncbi:hypothetical protein B0H11DRAFT_2085208 [Mycena galericulata]|nr:hypothetical protein B0H11DRAFT_2085208 [Mycena galericulata]